MIVRNEDIKEIIAEIPEGHRHIRTTLKFKDGIEYTFQEAAIAGIVRAFINIKTHPARKKAHLVNRHLLERKDGYAEWQLLEEK